MIASWLVLQSIMQHSYRQTRIIITMTLISGLKWSWDKLSSGVRWSWTKTVKGTKRVWDIIRMKEGEEEEKDKEKREGGGGSSG